MIALIVITVFAFGFAIGVLAGMLISELVNRNVDLSKPNNDYD